jgi:hypothetical protein
MIFFFDAGDGLGVTVGIGVTVGEGVGDAGETAAASKSRKHSRDT